MRNRKQVLTTILLATLLSIVFVTQNFTYLAKGQTATILPNVNVTIQSPENKTYTESTVPLEFTINSSYTPLEFSYISHPSRIIEYGFLLDYNTDSLVQQLSNYTNDVYVQLNKISNSVQTFQQADGRIRYSLESLGNNLYKGNATMTNLSEGNHNITFWAVGIDTNYISYQTPFGYLFKVFQFQVTTTPTTPTLTPTPTVPELSWLAVLPLLAALPLIAIAAMIRQTRRGQSLGA